MFLFTKRAKTQYDIASCRFCLQVGRKTLLGSQFDIQMIQIYKILCVTQTFEQENWGERIVSLDLDVYKLSVFTSFQFIIII